MGFGCHRFVGVNYRDFICFICKGVPSFYPVECPCQTIFCRDCIDDQFENRGFSKSCPACKRIMRPNDFIWIKKAAQTAWCQLRIRCEFFDRGCPKIIQIQEEPHHKKICPFRPTAIQPLVAPTIRDTTLPPLMVNKPHQTIQESLDSWHARNPNRQPLPYIFTQPYGGFQMLPAESVTDWTYWSPYGTRQETRVSHITSTFLRPHVGIGNNVAFDQSDNAANNNWTQSGPPMGSKTRKFDFNWADEMEAWSPAIPEPPAQRLHLVPIDAAKLDDRRSVIQSASGREMIKSKVVLDDCMVPPAEFRPEAEKCGYQFEVGDIGWICETCQITDFSILCNYCFNRGNHSWHTYNKMFPQPGSVCKCGQNGFLLRSGFCREHDKQDTSNESSAAAWPKASKP